MRVFCDYKSQCILRVAQDNSSSSSGAQRRQKVVLTGETWFFLLTHVQDCRSASLVACNQFTSDLFPWERSGLGRVGVKGKVSGQSREAKVRAAEDQGGKPQVA